MASLTPPQQDNEPARQDAVERLGVLDTPADPRLDALTREATLRLRVPISTISILDKNREWYKSCQGLDAKEGPREIAFCSWALYAHDIFIVNDTLKDPRFQENPYVIGKPYIRFYAGFAILDRHTHLPIGVFCIKDTQPRELSIEETGTLFELSKQASDILNEKTLPKISY